MDGDVRVVILSLRQRGYAVDEAHRGSEVREPELALERAVDLVPAVGRFHLASMPR